MKCIICYVFHRFLSIIWILKRIRTGMEIRSVKKVFDSIYMQKGVHVLTKLILLF